MHNDYDVTLSPSNVCLYLEFRCSWRIESDFLRRGNV